MKFKEWEDQLDDGTILHCYQWAPDNDDVKAVVQIVHGCAEYALRYDDFAKFLVSKNYAVVAEDHRGHGKTAQKQDDLGFFKEKHGWEAIINDLNHVTKYIKNTFSKKPIFMFGASMGSFMTRNYGIVYGKNISGMILCGTSNYNELLLIYLICLAKLRQMVKGPKATDHFIHNLTFKKLNKRFQNKNSFGTEWLSTNKEIQIRYKNDKLAGHVLSTSGFKDLFSGLLFIAKKKNVQKTPDHLPILVIAGSDDPVGKFGKAVKQTVNLYETCKKNVESKIYPNARHEILNETIKDQVYNDILNFIEKNLKKDSLN
ncbi:alpha/beta fold hydrolase [Mycoplasma sp. SG1]|uniref:alpha/beta fold hydrolase n=1 Tax=Mycoplasma sp. SG1 TaxID=2810348 RepID=UPI002024BA44|nr:alpha/beta hydrolase [Mycoplasma sp. SG1]URM52982.1 alpha/beta hydrolase [Mycoplasma sp. SG1]